MTSEKVMLTLAVVLIGGCAPRQAPIAEPLVAPYDGPRVWAVAPLNNESGSLEADGVALADHLARQLETTDRISVMPVSRTLAAMDALRMSHLASPQDATRLLATLNADALLVGTVTDYDPYDPPKLGMALRLFTQRRLDEYADPELDIRHLTRAATDGGTNPKPRPRMTLGSNVSAVFNGASPQVREALKRYAVRRGANDWPDPQGTLERAVTPAPDEHWRRYLLSIDLFSEFVSYAMAKRLLGAEARRLTPPPPTP